MQIHGLLEIIRKIIETKQKKGEKYCPQLIELIVNIFLSEL